jgi:hypothetical protein
MANAEKGEASLTVGDKAYTLRFGWNEIAEVEDLLDVAFFSDLSPKFANVLTVRAGEWRAVLWAALRGGGHKDIDLLAAGELIGAAGMEAVSQAINDAISRTFPEASAAPRNPPKAGRSTGVKR